MKEKNHEHPPPPRCIFKYVPKTGAGMRYSHSTVYASNSPWEVVQPEAAVRLGWALCDHKTAE